VPTATPTAGYTYMIFMNGSDLESESGAATADLQEMMTVGSSDKVNIVVETLGTSAWQTPDISNTANQRWLVTAEGLRLVTAHLGAGASLAAVRSGRSVDTTMGFTPLEGLVMATRSGTIDPGLLLFVLRHSGATLDEVEDALEHRSGLLGLSGVSADLREVLAAADLGQEAAALAYEVFVYRIRTSIAAMAAATSGLDALVYTGGAGTASARLRADVSAGLAFLGIELDEQLNAAGATDRVISARSARVASVVVEAREDLEIAGHVRRLL
jgi:acetate kinase